MEIVFKFISTVTEKKSYLLIARLAKEDTRSKKKKKKKKILLFINFWSSRGMCGRVQ